MSKFICYALAVFAVLASTVGCATFQVPGRVPFTEELRQQYELSDADLANLQYYTSSDITLQHELTSGSHAITPGHILKSQQGKLIEEIDIVGGTPGVASFVGVDYIAAIFENKGDTLTFKPLSANGGNVGNYKLAAKSWADDAGQMDYEGQTYWAVNGSSEAYLLIDFQSLSDLVKKRRVLPGVRLDDKPAK